MRFDTTLPIYLQLNLLVENNILQGQWKEEDRIPSIRDFAEACEVNPNTILRSYNELQDRGIIYNKRGVGYFVQAGAVDIIKAEKLEKLRDSVFQTFFNDLQHLGITPEMLANYYNEFLQRGEI
ncbi:MAG: GntR family transcriptional regulator [Spirochaetales bacterium]|nr:GntR family transcriptional regulator [Spirochaetales bacterium]